MKKYPLGKRYLFFWLPQLYNNVHVFGRSGNKTNKNIYLKMYSRIWKFIFYFNILDVLVFYIFLSMNVSDRI